MKRIAIVGLGLIGASLGMALKAAWPDLEVLGSDLDLATLEKAIEMGAISGPLNNCDLDECQVVFIATPLRAIPQVLINLRSFLSPGTIVSDVGSVKSWVMGLFDQLLPKTVVGIGGHPLAGSDRSGITGADRFLLENAVYALTPTPMTSPEQILRLEKLLRATGAYVMCITAESHDYMVSKVSHLPHIVAASLMNNLEGQEEALRLAAGGLRDTTRIAASNPELWEDIILFNREAVAAEIQSFISHLNIYLQVIENQDRKQLRAQLSSAQWMRKNLPSPRVSLINSIDIVAIVPDQPGVIGDLGTWLGKAGININDIQIMGVRDENEGSVRLGVPHDQAAQALALLKSKGIKAWLRE